MTTADDVLTAQLRDVMERYFLAINDEDYDALAAVYASDAVVRPPGVQELRGSAAIVSWYRDTFARFPDHHDQPVRTILGTDGASAAVEIRFTGRTRAGQSFDVEAVDLFGVRHGQITTMKSWLDTAAFAAAVAHPSD